MRGQTSVGYNHSPGYRKGQIISVDLVFAGFLFFLLLGLLLSNWDQLAIKTEQKLRFDKTHMTALRMSDILVKTQGTPNNWEEDPGNVRIPGLASIDRNLSSAKVDALLALDYNTTKRLLNLGKFDFNLNITGTTKSFGVKDTNGNDVISVQRKVLYEKQARTLLINMWNR